VAATEAEVARSKGQLDRLRQGLAGNRDLRRTLEPDLYQQCWKVKAHNVASFMPLPVMAAIGGAAIGVRMLANMVPALQPLRGILMIGSLIAGFKYIPRGIGWAVRNYVLPGMTDRAMVRNMEGRLDEYERYLARAEQKRDAALQAATQRLWDEAQKKAAEDAKKPKAEVKVEEQAITIGGIRVDKKHSTPAGA